MTAPAAARLGDDIGHPSLLGMIAKVGAGLVAGAVVAAVVAGAIVALPELIAGAGIAGAAAAGGEAALAMASFGAAGSISVVPSIAALVGTFFAFKSNPIKDLMNSINEFFDKTFPPTVTGTIITGSPNIKINSKPAARAAANLLIQPPPKPVSLASKIFQAGAGLLGATLGFALGGPIGMLAGAAIGAFLAAPSDGLPGTPTDDDKAACSRHPPIQHLAEGSSNVLFNGQPAHRVGDKITCSAATSSGSPNVVIGGGTLQVRDVETDWREVTVNVLAFTAILYATCRGIGSAEAELEEEASSIVKLLSKNGCLLSSVATSLAGNAAWAAASKFYDKVTTAFGNPVHALSGAKFLNGDDDLDFVLPSRLPLVWQRSYNSLDLRAGMFGQGFSLPIEVELKLNQGGDTPHYFIDQQGREIPFENVLPGRSFFNYVEGYSLACLGNGHYVVQDLDEQYYEFGAQTAQGAHTLKLRRIEDRNGNWLALRRDDNQRLINIADSSRNLYQLEYHPTHSERLIRVELSTNKRAESPYQPAITLVSYAYDSQGRLISVTNRQGVVTRRFSWHDTGAGKNLIASHTTPTGLLCSYEWQQFEHPRVVKHTTSAGESWHASYVMPDEEQAGSSEVIDNLGHKQIWTWNKRFNPLSYQNEVGELARIEWDKLSFMRKLIQPNGGVWEYEYDERGNLVKQIDPEGHCVEQQWRFERAVLRNQTENAKTTNYNYDHRGNLISIVDPAKRKTSLSRDEYGQIIVVTDPRGGITQSAWNNEGQLAAYTDCSKSTTHYSYDIFGNLIEVRDAAGRINKTEYDELNQIKTNTDAGGGKEYYFWHASGQLARYHDAVGNKTRYQWNEKGQLTQVSNPMDEKTNYHYHPNGTLSHLTNPKNESYYFHYDAADRLTGQTGLDGLSEQYQLDQMGLPILVRQAAGTEHEIQIELQRDLIGRLLCKATPESITRYQYQQQQLTKIQRWQRKAGNETLEDQQGELLDEIELEYDISGNLISESSTWYPALLAQVGIESQEAQSYCHKYQYDILGNRTQSELPDGEVINALYYGSGHLHQLNLAHPDGQYEVLADFERDVLHREVERSQGKLLSRSSYNRRGHLERINSRFNGVELLDRHWGYAANGECTSRSSRDIGWQTYQYDAAGRITASRQMDRLIRGAGGESLSQAPRVELPDEGFEWDAASNPVSGFNVQANRIKIYENLNFEYDAYGRIIQKNRSYQKSKNDQQPTKQQLYWNQEHQLIKVNTDGKESLFAYDAIGRRIASKGADKLDELVLTVWQGMQAVQQRHLQQTLLHKTSGQHIVTTVYEANSYTPLARIETFKGSYGDTIKQLHKKLTKADLKPIIYHFHNSPNGTVEAMTNQQGKIIWQGHSNVWGELEREEINEIESRNRVTSFIPDIAQQSIRMPGQHHDRVTGLYYNTFRYYDPETSRFISPDPIGLAGGDNIYQYAPNPLSWIDPWGLASCNAKFESRKAAFRALKRDAGIPSNQHPDMVEKVKMTDRNDHQILDENNKPISTREYHFTKPDGTKIVAQDHSAGHSFGPKGTPGNQGPHFNPRNYNKVDVRGMRHGTAKNMFDHYSYPK